MSVPHKGECGIVVEEVLCHLSYPIRFDIPDSIKMLCITSPIKESPFTSGCFGSVIAPASGIHNALLTFFILRN